MALVYTSPTCYVNEHQRNVHIWASEREEAKLSLVLLGGFFIQEDGPGVPWNTFFTWIDVFIEDPQGPGESICLLPCEDPRIHGLPPSDMNGVVRESNDVKLRTTNRKDDDFVKPGHYTLCINASRKIKTFGKPVVLSYAPQSQKEPKINRNETVKKHVRERDGGCLLTGAIATPRCRGQDHTGFHVAHIYPLAWRNERLRRYFLNQKLLSKKAFDMLVKDGVDSEGNCIELLSTVHNAYDDFQFGFRPGDLQIHKFEKTSASAFLNPTITRLMTGPVSQTPTYSPNFPADMAKGLLEFHFKYGILLNCAGGGRKVATNAVNKTKVDPKPDAGILTPVY